MVSQTVFLVDSHIPRCKKWPEARPKGFWAFWGPFDPNVDPRLKTAVVQRLVTCCLLICLDLFGVKNPVPELFQKRLQTWVPKFQMENHVPEDAKPEVLRGIKHFLIKQL